MQRRGWMRLTEDRGTVLASSQAGRSPGGASQPPASSRPAEPTPSAEPSPVRGSRCLTPSPTRGLIPVGPPAPVLGPARSPGRQPGLDRALLGGRPGGGSGRRKRQRRGHPGRARNHREGTQRRPQPGRVVPPIAGRADRSAITTCVHGFSNLTDPGRSEIVLQYISRRSWPAVRGGPGNARLGSGRMAAQKGKTLQLRVNADYARRFAAVAKARGLTESGLLKVGADKVLAEAEGDIDALKARCGSKIRPPSGKRWPNWTHWCPGRPPRTPRPAEPRRTACRFGRLNRHRQRQRAWLSSPCRAAHTPGRWWWPRWRCRWSSPISAPV